MSQNSPYMRGIVRENDDKNARSRVEFEAEDNVSSYWLDWPTPMAGKSRFYNAPDIGSQVRCLVDWRGEDGTIIGPTFNKEDRPPTENGKLMKADLEGGLDTEYDKASGNLTVKSLTSITFQVGNSRIVLKPGEIEIRGALIKLVQG